jgi:hypothetical protein
MSEAHARYYTDIKCPECDTVLAKKDAEGVVYMGSVPVVATIAICPECNGRVPISIFAINGNGLEFGDVAIEEIARMLTLISGNGGYGTLMVKFQKMRARWVGLGESMKDCG